MNKRRLAVPLLLLLAAALAALSYFHFFHIGRFNTVIGQGAAESPDGAYQVTLSVCTAETLPLSGGELLSYIDEHDLNAYVVGRLWYDPAVENGVTRWSDERSKVIYYARYTGETASLTWSDDSTVVINGTALIVPGERYDYRRAF